MELKENIKKLLVSLKSVGYDRRRIERELVLAENSIDQNLARGGTQKLFTSLKLLADKVLPNAISKDGIGKPENVIRETSDTQVNDNTDYRALYIELLKKENEEKSEIIRANLTAIISNLDGLAVGSKMLQAHVTTALEYYALELANGDKKKAAKLKGDMDTRVIELLGGQTKKNNSPVAGN